MNLDIVIVNWNSGRLLSRCIVSLPQALVDEVRIGSVTVVDNASCDGSTDIETPPGLRVLMIRNTLNRGFAAACNQGARHGSEAHLLFLNPDTELSASSLARPLRLLNADVPAGLGIIATALVTPSGERERNVARFPTPGRLLGQALGLDRLAGKVVRPHFMTEWDHLETRVVDQVPGAFMLMRRKDFERVGGFDEQFFVYMEDVDFALRLRDVGLVSLYMHDCVSLHVGGGTTRAVKDKRLFYLLRSRMVYARKHFGHLGHAVVVVATLLIEPISRLTVATLRGNIDDARATLRATAWLWRSYFFRRAVDRAEPAAPHDLVKPS